MVSCKLCLIKPLIKMMTREMFSLFHLSGLLLDVFCHLYFQLGGLINYGYEPTSSVEHSPGNTLVDLSLNLATLEPSIGAMLPARRLGSSMVGLQMRRVCVGHLIKLT